MSDQLVEMRKILLTELDAGLGAEPMGKQDLEPEIATEVEAAPAESSTKSKYQQMLAKAKAEKAAKK